MKSDIDKQAVLTRIGKLVSENPVVIFMKGEPAFPMCGYSARAAGALRDCGFNFVHVNVLTDAEIFECLPQYADWETFPQIYIDGQLTGGCDIVVQLHERNELRPLVESAHQRRQQS